MILSLKLFLIVFFVDIAECLHFPSSKFASSLRPANLKELFSVQLNRDKSEMKYRYVGHDASCENGLDRILCTASDMSRPSPATCDAAKCFSSDISSQQRMSFSANCGLQTQGHTATSSLRLKGGGRLWREASRLGHLPASRVPLSLKLVVSACGGAWCFGSISGLFTIFGIILSPGGVDFLIDNYGILIPSLFLGFHSILAAVQMQKLIAVLRAASLSSIRWTLLVQVLDYMVSVPNLYASSFPKPSAFDLIHLAPCSDCIQHLLCRGVRGHARSLLRPPLPSSARRHHPRRGSRDGDDPSLPLFPPPFALISPAALQFLSP